MKIAFIGGGTMGEAIASALLAKGTSSPTDIFVSEPVPERRDYLKNRYGVKVTGSSKEAVGGAEVILMSIKPQSLLEALPDLAGGIKPSQLVLSIIAGAKIATLRDGLGHKPIVRSMPNTPAQIGEGVTVWTATPEVTEAQKDAARAILSVMGKELYVNDEKSIDMATAVSGSGPAYFFLFAEAWTDAAVNLGLPRETAKAMVLQTMLGSAHLIEKSGKEPAELRQMVTSKGGTTAAALGVFEEGDFKNLVARAIEAAYKRARQLGGEKV
jgi:pyrroline-5-carboxylate reductase